jgi:hypothetical protein
MEVLWGADSGVNDAVDGVEARWRLSAEPGTEQLLLNEVSICLDNGKGALFTIPGTLHY